MLNIRRSAERGHANHGWLDSYHSFSFADYHDPDHVQFGSLRVINEDVIAPNGGFPPHPHRDMEIITYMLGGALKHHDSQGNGSIIRQGDIQRMTAGHGIVHSEFNASDQEPAHLLQIWIRPEQTNLQPDYEQIHIPIEQRQGKFALIASPTGVNGSVTIHQDATLYSAILNKADSIDHSLEKQRRYYLHIARGEVLVNGEVLQDGDAMKLENETSLHIDAFSKAELLLFDLA